MATLPVLAEGLRKRYGRADALDGFDLAVPEGAVCGLLGPNGAGKTTAVRIQTTLLRPPEPGPIRPALPSGRGRRRPPGR